MGPPRPRRVPPRPREIYLRPRMRSATASADNRRLAPVENFEGSEPHLDRTGTGNRNIGPSTFANIQPSAVQNRHTTLPESLSSLVTTSGIISTVLHVHHHVGTSPYSTPVPSRNSTLVDSATSTIQHVSNYLLC